MLIEMNHLKACLSFGNTYQDHHYFTQLVLLKPKEELEQVSSGSLNIKIGFDFSVFLNALHSLCNQGNHRHLNLLAQPLVLD